MTREELAKAYADGFNKEYQQIAYDAFLCGYGAKCESFVSEGLEKAAGEYAVDNAQYYYEDDDNAICSTADILKPAFIAGAEWMKSKMLEEAVEGIAHPDDCEIWVNLVGYGYKFKDGDKVRVIVIKEDKR